MKINVSLTGIILSFLVFFRAFAQDSTKMDIIFPEGNEWNIVKEGEKLEFRIKASGSPEFFTFNIEEGRSDDMIFDSTGFFSWTPNFDMVGRLEGSKKYPLVFTLKDNTGKTISKPVEITILHVNRPPLVGELKTFYIQYDVNNIYKPDPSVVRDEDNDPIVFIPVNNQMPEGAKLSEQGEFSWKPSLTQYRHLRNNPLTLDFFVEDQPNKARTKGKLVIQATQLDLPPVITLIPDVKEVRYEEDETVNFKFYLADPNGDEDIQSFGFICDNPSVPKSALVKNTATQYEFIWEPGYYFVKDPFDSLSFTLTFFVIDKSQKRSEKKIKATILNAVNEAEKDHTLYLQYRSAVVRAWDLMEQLKEKEKELKKDYQKAKKGKKSRAITNASLGAVSGIAPVINGIPTTTQRAVSVVGGTTVMTIGTLEATEVIGKSTRDLIERLNYVMEKKNELQTKGDTFARKYSLKSFRRKQDFSYDLDQFLAVMNLKGLVALELNAGWQNKQKATDSNLAKTFKDFAPEEMP